jgi:hypothetical protein
MVLMREQNANRVSAEESRALTCIKVKRTAIGNEARAASLLGGMTLGWPLAT